MPQSGHLLRCDLITSRGDTTHRLPAELPEPGKPKRKKRLKEVSSETPQELNSPKVSDIDWDSFGLPPIIAIPPMYPPTEKKKNTSEAEVLSSLASIMEYVSVLMTVTP